MKRLFSLPAVILLLSVVLSACAEGEKTSGMNAPPVADAGQDQNIVTGSTVTVDGSGSSTAHGCKLTYGWSFTSKPAGSAATLSGTTAVNPEFTADIDGSYVLSLTVNDGALSSSPDTVTITATTGNAAPVAHAGMDQSVITGSLVTLDGSNSSDANGDALTYSWSFTSVPALSNAVLSSTTTSNPTFTADKDGSYVVSLTVNDGTVDSAADTVTITATTGNAAPVADAGANQNVATGSLVTLNGSGSDANGDALTYSWSFTSVPALSSAALSDTTVSNPTFTADKDGSYVVGLTVNDGTVDSVADTVVITAAPGGPAPAAGSLDTTFDTDGIVITPLIGENKPRDIALQSDGKIVTVGSAKNGTYYHFTVVRYNTDGSLDPAFDTDGIVTTVVGTFSNARSVAIQSDGKIVAAGEICDNALSYCAFGVARYNPNGSLDTGFGTGGIVTTRIGSITDWPHGVAIQSDGKIVVAGKTNTIYNGDFALVRYNPNGTLDSTFDGDGIVTTAVFTDYESGAYKVAIQSDGKIVAAGYAENNVTYNRDFVLVRYNSNGTLDSSFDADGKVVTDFTGPGGRDEAMNLVIQPDGRIIAAGLAYNGANNDIALARYEANGSLDASFDGDGKVATAIGTGSDVAYAVAVQPNGKILAAGSYNNGTDMDYALVRYLADGTLDTTFDGDGIAVAAIGPEQDLGSGIALEPDGKIVVTGFSQSSSSYYFGIARFNP